MQKIIIEKPYEFIPAHRGNWWPSFIQRFRLYDLYLRKMHGIESYEIRHTERLRESLQSGHGILLTPNHPRPADPVALGWLGREAHTHLYAMASWHLFHQDRLTTWAIRKMGAFSVYREGIDRKAIDTAISILANAERPLILFPEGSVSRTNDKLNALLEGVAFIARNAAKQRQKHTPDGKIVVHPIAIKYRFRGDLVATLDPVLSEIEQRFTWKNKSSQPLLHRIRQIGIGLLALKELEAFGEPQSGKLSARLQGLINRLLQPIEQEWLGTAHDGPVVPRVKALRMKILPDLLQGELSPSERASRWDQLADLYLSQQVASYPPDYVTAEPSMDRLLETVERYEEDLTDTVRVHGKLHAIIEVGPPITVSSQRDRKAESDPLIQEIERHLQSMLDRLATESPKWPTAQSQKSPSPTEVRVRT